MRQVQHPMRGERRRASRVAARAAAMLLGLACLAAAGADVARAAPCPENAIAVAPGDSLARASLSAPEGAAFCLLAGLHRQQRAQPKAGQRFHGAPGAVMTGAEEITAFEPDADGWSAPAPRPRGERRKAEYCLPGFPRCDHPVMVFVDDRPLRHVDDRAALAPGAFFLDYARGRVTLADDPRGRRVEITAAPYAFRGGAPGVVIQGLTIEKYAPPIQYGAIGYNMPSAGWRVENVVVRQNYGVGVIVGSDSVVRASVIRDNGEMGAGCVGRNILFEGNEIRGNGFFAGLDPLWEGGGAKCALTDGLIVRRNLLAENNGMGFWTDIDNVRTLYEGNLFERNLGGGVSHEISYAAEIRDNVFIDNGPREPTWLWGCAVQVQDSQEVRVTGNRIDMRAAGQGVCLIEQDRGDGALGPYQARRNRVDGNLVVAGADAEGGFGAISDHDPAGMASGDNRIDANRYVVPGLTDDRWAWVDGFYDWAEYRARSGQDATSTIAVGPADAAVLAEIDAAAQAIRDAVRRARSDQMTGAAR